MLSADKGKLDRIVDVKQFGAIGDGVTDDTVAIQSAINSGLDIKVTSGSYLISSPLTIGTQGQTFACHDFSTLLPNYDGDAIRITAAQCRVLVNVSGALQPTGASNGAAIAIGYNGANAQQCSVARSSVNFYKGTGIRWDQGSMLDFSGVRIFECTVDGISCTGIYDDNNHACFFGTHVISCGRYGYSILKNDPTNQTPNNNDSRHHVFSNAKAFGNNVNFHIQTYSNVGTIFSEMGTNPDVLTSSSFGNDLCYISIPAFFETVIDLGSGNTISGFTNFDRFEDKYRVTRTLDIQNSLEGALRFTQKADRTFTDEIFGSTNQCTVVHGKGTASERTDIFQDRVQFAQLGNSPFTISSAASSVVTVEVNAAMAPGQQVNWGVQSVQALAGQGDSCLISLSGLVSSDASKLSLTGSIATDGSIGGVITNISAASVSATTLYVRWIVVKHFA